jgi:hypothetical protein
MAAVSSRPNALISRRAIGISLTYGYESDELPGCQQGSASSRTVAVMNRIERGLRFGRELSR